MTPQELKNSILQLAIQGKLVDQRPEEGTAEELYQQIQAEKQRLIKAGTIKKEKTLPPITEEEIPFDIPPTWKWVRFCDVIDVRDGTHDTPKYVPVGIPLVTSKNLVSNIIDFENTKLISFEDAENINARSAVDNGDILFAMIGTIGNPVLVKKDREFCIKNMALFKAISQNMINMEYLLVFLQKEQYVMKKKASGGVQSFVSLKYLRSYLFPLPPLAEQKRIVAKLEELLPYIDRYEKAWSELETFQKRFPTDMQKSLLQTAIQGKLVDQYPEEGTGEELYQQIQEEKQRLIKAGTIKKEKPLPEITEDEIPFAIPSNWKWCYVGDLFQHNTGKALNGTTGQGTMLSYITTSNLYWNRFELDKLKEMPFKDTEIEKCTVTKGDLLVIEGGFYFGRAAVWEFDYDMRIQNHIHRLRPYGEVCIEFFYYLFYLYKQAGWIDYKGIGMQGLSSSALHKIAFPLPPLAEQKRIVAKLEELLPLCEKLK